MSQQPRPTLDYDHESYGTRWYDSPDVADIFHPLPDTSLVCLDREAYLASITDTTPRCIHCNRPVRLDQHECYDCQYGNLADLAAKNDALFAERRALTPRCEQTGLTVDECQCFQHADPHVLAIRRGEIGPDVDADEYASLQIDHEQIDAILATNARTDPFADDSWDTPY